VNLRKGLTVIRIFGTLSVIPGVAGTQSEFHAGIAMMEEDAALAGAFPDPATDANFGWLWWQRGAPQEDIANRYNVDVRSQRKFPNGDSRLYMIVENDDSVQNMTVTFGLRVLYKLP